MPECGRVFKHETRDIVLAAHVDDMMVSGTADDLSWFERTLRAHYDLKYRVLGPDSESTSTFLNREIVWNNEGIRWLGAILLKLSGSDEKGHTFSTNQMTYITDCSDTFFLSRGACVDLGIISEKFPTIGEAFLAEVDTSTISSMTTHTRKPSLVKASCGCPKRTVPPHPPQPPVLLTDRNRLQLEKFLLEFYASSTFNTCPHQPLPHMSGPSMKLMIDPKATPVAHHKATPAPPSLF